MPVPSHFAESTGNRVLGKQPARRDRRTLKLSKYLKPPLALSPPPVKCGYIQRVTNLGVMLNDDIGDCTCACAGHMIQQWTATAGKQVIPTDQDILTAYESPLVGGYVQGDPSTDNGANPLDLLNYWRKTGIGGDKILTYVALDISSPRQVKQSIFLFGNAYIGIQLPLSAQSQNGLWTMGPGGIQAPDNQPGSWGGHAIPAVGYSHTGRICVITWGQFWYMDPNFWPYVDEAYAVLSQDWLEHNPTAINHLNMAQLLADLKEITA